MEKFTYYSRSVPSFTAMSSYSCLFLAISSRQPKQVSWEAATREARVSPAIKKKEEEKKNKSENVNNTVIHVAYAKYPHNADEESGAECLDLNKAHFLSSCLSAPSSTHNFA